MGAAGRMDTMDTMDPMVGMDPIWAVVFPSP